MKSLEALRALGTGPEPPGDAKKRVYGALLASLEVAAAAGMSASVSHSPQALSPTPAPLVTGLASSKALLVAAGIWVFGGATGAALYGALHPQQVRVVYVDRPVLTTAPPSVPAEAAPSAAPVSAPSASSHGPASITARRPGSDLAAERGVLDAARASAAHGEPAQVLAFVEQHRQRFARGRLAEEREALAIRALLALGRSAEAQARADAFRAAYPHSFLTPVIDSALSAP